MSDLYCHHSDGTIHVDSPRPTALLSGSFNPLHHGHLALAQAAASRLGCEVHFELSITNAEKPELPAEEVTQRLRAFAGVAPVWVTRAWSFEMKADLFPGAVFVLGHDTAIRLVDPRFYADAPDRLEAALRKLRERGCRILVGGRIDTHGVFCTWDEGAVAKHHREMFTALTERDFRIDVSSREIRAKE